MPRCKPLRYVTSSLWSDVNSSQNKYCNAVKLVNEMRVVPCTQDCHAVTQCASPVTDVNSVLHLMVFWVAKLIKILILMCTVLMAHADLQ